MRSFGMSMLWFWVCYLLVTAVGILHTVFNIYVLHMQPMDWHPLYNILLFTFFGWLYLNGLTDPTAMDAILTGAIWAGICIVFDVFGWVLIKHPWSLTFREFYIDYQPWISLIYCAIFLGPIIGYLFTLL